MESVWAFSSILQRSVRTMHILFTLPATIHHRSIYPTVMLMLHLVASQHNRAISIGNCLISLYVLFVSISCYHIQKQKRKNHFNIQLFIYLVNEIRWCIIWRCISVSRWYSDAVALSVTVSLSSVMMVIMKAKPSGRIEIEHQLLTIFIFAIQ